MWNLVLHNRGPKDATLTDDVLAAHLNWIKDQQIKGTMLFAGPSADGTVGIMVFGHLSASEAERLCLTDPLIAGRREAFEIIPWDVHQVLGVGDSNLL
jgi:uncharacterized protein YciI